MQPALLTKVGQQCAKTGVLDASTAVEGVPGAGLGLVQHIGKGVGKIVHRQPQRHLLPPDPAFALQLTAAHIQHAEQQPFGLEAGMNGRAPPMAQVRLIALGGEGQGKCEGLLHTQAPTSATNW